MREDRPPVATSRGRFPHAPSLHRQRFHYIPRPSMLQTRPSKPLISGLAVAFAVHSVALAWCAMVRLGTDARRFLFEGNSVVIQAAFVDASASTQADSEVKIEPVEPEPTVVVEPDSVRIADRRYVRESSRIDLPHDVARPPATRPNPVSVRPPLRRAELEPPSEQPTQADPRPALPRRHSAQRAVQQMASAAAPPQTAGTRSAHVPQVVFNPPPSYPPQAVARGLEGVVLLEVTIGRDGTVQRIRVLESSGHAVLDGAAVSAIQRWRARPWTGGPDEADVELPLRFRIPQ